MISAIIGGIVALAKGGVEGYKEHQKGRRELQAAQLDLKKAELENRARLMRDQQTNNHTWEMAALRETGKVLKWASFVQFSVPLCLTMAAPYFDLDANKMWLALKLVPEWWQKCYIAMNGTIWGVMQLKELGLSPGRVAGMFRRKKSVEVQRAQADPAAYVTGLVKDLATKEED